VYSPLHRIPSQLLRGHEGLLRPALQDPVGALDGLEVVPSPRQDGQVEHERGKRGGQQLAKDREVIVARPPRHDDPSEVQPAVAPRFAAHDFEPREVVDDVPLNVDGEQAFAERALERRGAPQVLEDCSVRRPSDRVDESIDVFDVNPDHGFDEFADSGIFDGLHRDCSEHVIPYDRDDPALVSDVGGDSVDVLEEDRFPVEVSVGLGIVVCVGKPFRTFGTLRKLVDLVATDVDPLGVRM
jgi:hypothetical protein